MVPDRPSIRKDLGYTLLKVGETEAAREQFAAAMRLDPGDVHVALEYAFLCFETGQRVMARRVFARYRESNDTAARAFENIDKSLRDGILRWRQAVDSPSGAGNFSAHEELARLAEQHDEKILAAEHYQQAWRLRTDRRDLLLALGRLWQQLGRTEDASAALLAASRGSEPRVAETARELLPTRYPFVSEFEQALRLDPENSELRRELAYLLLQLDHSVEAEQQLESLVALSPGDLQAVTQLGFLRMARGDSAGAMPLFNQVLQSPEENLAERVRTALRLPPVLSTRPTASNDPNTVNANNPTQAGELATKSLEKGYLRDALKYLNLAHENDPVDFHVMLQLGQLENTLKNDAAAVRWFALARRSPDPQIATAATRAYRNLQPSLARVRTTVWLSPVYSSRWRDIFAYAQAKAELRLPAWRGVGNWLRPYGSIRFVGDTQGALAPAAGLAPQYLSESSAIVGLGVATAPWRRITAWFEAGEQLRYRTSSTDTARMLPDYRGGVSFAKGFGHLLSPSARGVFAETNDDAVYVSRFAQDTLFYSQNRTGYTFRSRETGGFHAQVFWNGNATVDAKSQYWANTIETGPGVRFRFESLAPSLLFSVNLLRGAYLVNTGNPRGPIYNDLRIGVWYAFTR